MAKVTLATITSGYASTEKLNSNFNAIEAAFDNTISRDGSSPNQMEANLDMNGHAIINAADVYVSGTPIITEMTNIYNDYLSFTTNVTISTDPPSGGVDGDIWFRVSI